jgi:DNA polymerase III sliding clamp (beta) subunit (PCNA family)
MRIHCVASDLAVAAKYAARVLPATPPNAGVLLLEAGADSRVRATGRGIGTQAEDVLEGEILETGTVAVPAAPFLGCLVGLEEATLELSGSTVVIRAGRRRFQVRTAPYGVPRLELGPDACELALTSEQATRHFGKLLRGCTRVSGPLSGIHVSAAEKFHTVSTNGSMLAVVASDAPMSGTMPSGGVIIPPAAAQEICTLAKGDGISLRMTSRLMAATAGRRSYVSTLLDGQFPPWRTIVPRPSSSSWIELDREEAVAALTRLDALADRRLGWATVASWNPGVDVVELRLADETALDFVAAQTCGAGRMVLPIDRTLRLLQNLHVDHVRVEQADAQSAIRITSPDDENFVAVQAPVQTAMEAAA